MIVSHISFLFTLENMDDHCNLNLHSFISLLNVSLLQLLTEVGITDDLVTAETKVYDTL